MEGVDPNMIANNIESAYPTHPGAILKDEIEYRGITQHKLAQQMNVPYSALNEILNGKRPLTRCSPLKILFADCRIFLNFVQVFT